MYKGEEYSDAVKTRAKSLRFRTLTATICLIIAMFFYYMMKVTTKNAISWVDFILICILQMVTYSIYFPDGDLFGQKDEKFITNRLAYNAKADSINTNKKHKQLRSFCEYEYEERKKRYILTQCGYIGITVQELEKLKEYPTRELKKIESFTTTNIIDGEEKEKIIKFSSKKRKLLYNLIFKPLPIQKNHPETIMSAVENNGTLAIKDTSVAYKKQSHVKKFLIAILLGVLFGYISYTVRDGFGLTEIVSIIICLSTLITTAVTAFTSGEQCSKIYKSRFYLELTNFIEEFLEWDVQQEKQKEIIKE